MLFGLFGLLAALAVPAGQAAASEGLAQVRLTGDVVKVQAEAGGPASAPSGVTDDSQTLLRLPGGQLTPVTGLDDVPAGATASLTVSIPSSLEPALERLAGSGPVDDAREEPAAAGSAVARAVAGLAASRDLPLRAAIGTVAAADVPSVPAVHTVTVAVAGVNGFPATAYSDAVISSMVSSVSEYWSGQTGSAISFTRSGPITRYTSTSSCSNSAALWNEAVARTGFSWASNAHLVLLLPLDAYSAGFCGYGLGTVGSSVSNGGLTYVADTSWPALAHELGHNMSLLHGNELACSEGTYDSTFTIDGEPMSPSCSVTEYGDGFDVMGLSAPGSTGGLSSIGLARLGVLPSSQVQSVSAPGLTTLSLPALSTSVASTGIRAAAVTDPHTGDVYHLENRQPAGQDLYGWQGLGTQFWNGRTTAFGLRVLKDGAEGASVLLDPTPSGSGIFDPAAIVAPGSTFTSASGGVSITSTQNLDGTVTARVTLAGAGGVPDPDPVEEPPAETTLADPVITTSAPAVSAARTSAQVVVQVTGDGAAATGTVHVTGNDDTELGSSTLALGRAVVAIPSLGPGTHPLTVVYDGDGAVSAGTTSETLVVYRYFSRVRASLTPATKRAAAVVKVTVLSSGGVPAGTVRLVGSRSGVLAAARLSSGTAKLRLPRTANTKQTLQVVYVGSPTVAPSSASLAPR